MIIFVYNSDEQRQKIEGSVNTDSFIFYDDRKLKEHKKGATEMHKYGARKFPFAIVYDEENNPIKGFWSEANDVISDLINYLNA